MSFTNEFEWEDEVELEPIRSQSYEGYLEDSPPWPQWPTGRTFNPPSGTVPATGGFQTSSCERFNLDLYNLSSAVALLKNLLRERSPNLKAVSNRADVVTALSRQLVSRLKERWDVRRGCTQQDLHRLAAAVNTIRGGGKDEDTGSWPKGSSLAVQGPRKQARESLRHLLNWLRRAHREFPRI